MNGLLGSIEEFLNEQNAAETSVNVALSELLEMERKRVATAPSSRRATGRNRRRTGPETAIASAPPDGESVRRALSDMLSMENQRREAKEAEDLRRAEEARKRWLKEERKRAEDHAIVRSTLADLLPPQSPAHRSGPSTKRSGAASLSRIHPGIGAKIAGIGGWERAFAEDEYDNLILVQCVHVEALLSYLLLRDGTDIAGEISTHLSEKQREILRYFFSRQQRATLGLIQLWLVGLRRYLVDGSPAARTDRIVNWISGRFGDVRIHGATETASTLFCDKRLVAFIDSFRADYRNPLVHPENRTNLVFDSRQYDRWCHIAWGTPRLSDWLDKGWSGDLGWVSALVESAANVRQS